MKRKVLCIFFLIAYLLLFCTCLAPMVEREMAVLADIKHIKKNDWSNASLPAYSAQWDDVEGLFHVVEGSGWNTGTRVEEIDRQFYRNDWGHIVLHPGTSYALIISASRTPKEGDRVEAIEAKEKPGEKLIVFCPDGIQNIRPLQNNFTLVHQGETAVLLDTMGIKMPYFEHRMKNALADRILAEDLRIYSYSDAESFLRQLPMLAGIGALLLFGVILWVGTCRITKKQQPAWLLWVNVGMMGLSLGAVFLLGKAVDLPASLMPPENILELAHYKAEFSNIFAALADVGDKRLENLSIWCVVAAVAVLLVGILLGMAMLYFVQKISQKKSA